MGMRLHYADRYDVNYTDGNFNHDQDEFYSLLDECGCSIYYAGDGRPYEGDFSVPCEDIRETIKKIESGEVTPSKELGEDCDVVGWLNDALKATEVIGNPEVQFSWF